jgi:hypothetical protein
MTEGSAAAPGPTGRLIHVTSLILPRLIVGAGDQTQRRFLDFFAAAIRNPHTRRAYSRAVGEFLAWCEGHGVPSLASVRPLHVTTWIEASCGARIERSDAVAPPPSGDQAMGT